MSQVQIRQMPTATQQMAGSWFSSGYYGHFRAKSRGDLAIQFRQLARPNPPTKFLHRQHSEASSHPFSQHDNRFKFENDPLVRCTQAGFGKRKAQSRARGEFDPFFIGWLPENVDRKKFTDHIKTTSYADDFSGNLTSSQILSDIQSVSSPTPSEVSVYSSVYGHGQPDQQLAKQIHRETFERFSAAKTRRSKLQSNDRGLTVASCLVWNSTGDENKAKKTPTANSIKSRNSFHGVSSNRLPKLYHSQSMQTLKTIEQPRFAESVVEERRDLTGESSPRASSSLDQPYTNSMQCLISKYM